MRRLLPVLLGVLLALPAYADMYQDGSNAKQPQAANNVGKAAATYMANAYGNCTWDATHDVGACVNAAIAAAAAAGGGTVIAPTGTYGLSAKLVWPSTPGAAVRLQCAIGSGDAQGQRRGSTRFKWIGAAGGRMAEVKAVSGKLPGHEIHYCEFDGNHGLAADGLHIENSWYGHFDNLSFGGGFNGGNIVNLDVTTTTGAGTQNNTLDYLIIDNLYIDGVTTTAYTSNQLRLGSYMSATQGYMNAALNFMRNIMILGSAPSTGILCVGCDNNHISGRVFNNGTSVDLSIGRNGSIFYPANGNQFTPYFYYSGQMINRGETSFPGCTAANGCAYGNRVYLDQTNATPQPTIEPGTLMQVDGSYGAIYGYEAYGKSGQRPGFIVTTDYSILPACEANTKSYGTTTNLYMCNSTSTALLTADSLGGDRFFQRLNGTAGNQFYQFGSTAGTGLYEFVPTVEFDNGMQSSGYRVGNLGSQTNGFNYLYAGGWISGNTSHTWGFDLGLVSGTADANASLSHDGTAVMTWGSNLVTKVKYLAPDPSTPASSSAGCTIGMITTDPSFIYVCTAANTWKRAALTAF
jgi:hypothetical protein